MKLRCITYIFALVLLTSCNLDEKREFKETSNQSITMKKLSTVPGSVINNLSEKKIYFAHMSVGYNIVDGIEMLKSEYPLLNLNVLETREKKDFDQPVFAHSTIGSNNNPKSKINDFSAVLDSGIGDSLDFAFLKFCYIDVKRSTDINLLFNDYLALVKKINRKYPRVKILHFTVPLIVEPQNWKGRINKYLYRDHNINRNKINNLFRNHFPQNELFDLALIESLNSNGNRTKYSVFGKEVFVLNPKYTYDGRHLNDYGSKLVAEQLIIQLAELSTTQ